MAPIPSVGKSAHVASTAEDTQPRAPSISPRRIVVAVLLSLLTLGLLREPLSHCYHRMSQHFCNSSHLSVDDRARKLLSTTPLIDGHVDLPMALRFAYGNHIDNDDFVQAFTNGTAMGHVDIKRLRAGSSGGAFWSVFAPCPKDGDDFSDDNYAASVQFTLDQIDVMTRLQAAFSDDFSQKVDSASAIDAFKNGKFISPLGIEGLHQIGNSAANLRRFYDLGVRYATLTHNCNNKFADAALVENPMRKSEPVWGGVSPIGRKLIREMNRIGMIVDLAHVSEDTMVHVLGGSDDWDGSQAPVIFSHSSAWAVCPHPRNVKDHVLELVKARNSVVMVNVNPDFISCVDNDNENGIPDFVPQNSTLQHLTKHIQHIAGLVGWDYIGIGTDLDGIMAVPKGFEDVSKYPDLVAELLRQGVSEVDLAKFVGGNVLRVWHDVEAVAAKMQADRTPVMEDDVQLGM